MQALTEADPRQIAEFTLVGRLGGGGMGMVYLGRRRADDLPAAVKVIRPELLADEEVRARFDRETRAAMRVRSPRVAAVLGAGFDEGRAYLACEYIEAPTLDSAIANDGPLGEPALVALAAGLAEALIDIHGSGLQHRDLTPRNVLLTYAGPRVIDFGIAYVDDIPSMTSTGSIIGTPGYVAPERLRDHRSIPAGDLFAVGALLAFAATGRSPYGGGTPIGIHMRVADAATRVDLAGVPASFVPLVRDCLASDPAGRPDAWQFRDRVAEIAATRPRAAPAGGAGGAAPGGGADGAPATWTGSGTLAGAGAVTMADAMPPATERPHRRAWWLGIAVLAVAVVAGLVAVAPWRTAADDGAGGPSSPPASSPPASSAPASSAPASNSVSTSPSGDPATGGHLAPGTHVLDRSFFDNGLLRLTLTSVQVTPDGRVTASVRYDNVGPIGIPLMCALVTEPSTTTLRLSDGTVLRAAHTYCSDHPGAVITVDAGQNFTSYATFTQVTGPAGPAVLVWQSGNAISGQVGAIPL